MPSKPLADVAATGVRLDTLRALRDRLAVEIDATASARDVAALSARLLETLAEVAAAEAAEPKPKGTALDEFTRRRSASASGRTNSA